MWKLRIGAFLATGLLGLGISTAAWASSGGNANAGDVWVDSTTASSGGPGHEMDPHLPCQTIYLFGSGLADASDSFAIDGWPPSGSQEVDYTGTWSYDQSAGRNSGSQVIAVIDVNTLINQAEANGDSASAQGFHFKLDFSQDPQKHKTFWVDCTSSTSGGGGNTGGGGGNNDGGGNNGSGNDSSSSGGATSPSSGSALTLTGSSAIKTAVGSIQVSRNRKHKRHKAHPARRHHRPRRRSRILPPSFTG